MLNSAITDSTDPFAPGHLGELTGQVPPEMIDAVLETTGTIQQRLRRVPSRVVVYLLLAGALFTGQGWQQVWLRLSSGIPGGCGAPSKSALSQAMRRIGPKPLRELFTMLAGPGTTGIGQAVQFAGRRVVAIDGTQIPVADTEANRACFPKHSSGPNGDAGYPMIRLVALVACGTRSVIEATFGSDRVGELSYATQLVAALRPGMLLLGDRNFATYKFFTQIAGTKADFLLRGKTGATAMRLPILQRLADGSYLTHADGLPLRVIEAEVTITTNTGSRTSSYRLITSLLDPIQAPAHHLVRLYHHRWEIETAYCELKSTILTGRVLRARHPSGIEQEVWALLVAYQCLRTVISDAILDQPTIDPGRLSLTTALNTARDQIIHTTTTSPSAMTDLIGPIGTALLNNLIPIRGPRTRPRVIKRAISKYRAKGRHTDHHTYPATLHTRILTPDPNH